MTLVGNSGTPENGQSVSRPCPYCEGAGCSECDHTGQRVSSVLDLPGGGVMRVSGSAKPSPETMKALSVIGLAMEAEMARKAKDA